MITVNDISVQFGGTTLFSDVSFAINENDKIALMGKNGAGKSTLLKIIAGQSKPSTGNISAPKDAVVAYLPQHLLTTDGATVMEETSKAFGEIFQMKAEIDEIKTAKTAIFVGTEFSSVTGRNDGDEPIRKTPWGEMAFQIGGAKGFEKFAQ